MADINLLQNQLKDTTLLANRRSMMAIWILSGLFLLVLGAGVALYFLTNSTSQKANDVLASNNTLQTQIKQASGELENARTFQAKLSNIDLLLDNHIHISPLLEEIEKVTFQNSQYFNISIAQATGKVHVEGSVSTYTDLGKLLLGLSTSENFRNVKLLSVIAGSGDETSYRFSIDLNADADLFTNKK